MEARSHLHVHDSALYLGLFKSDPIHVHSARLREVGAGKEVALAPADDEEIAHLEGLALVDVVEGVVDGRCAAIEGVEVGQHLGLVGVGDFVDALDRAVGALDLLQRTRQLGLPASDARQMAFSWRLISWGISFAFIIGFTLDKCLLFLREEDELRRSRRRHLVGREPLHAERDDFRAGLAHPRAAGIAAEQDAVASEHARDAVEEESRRGLLQPPLLVHPDGHAVTHDDQQDLLAPDEGAEAVQALDRGGLHVRRNHLAFRCVDENCLHLLASILISRSTPWAASAWFIAVLSSPYSYSPAIQYS